MKSPRLPQYSFFHTHTWLGSDPSSIEWMQECADHHLDGKILCKQVWAIIELGAPLG